jgi:ribonuclease HII
VEPRRAARHARAGLPRGAARGARPAGCVTVVRAPRPVVRSENGLWAYERVLQRSGFPLVAGADEAGRGACAGPLVVAAAGPAARPARRGARPADSKLLTEAAREQAYDEVVAGRCPGRSWSCRRRGRPLRAARHERAGDAAGGPAPGPVPVVRPDRRLPDRRPARADAGRSGRATGSRPASPRRPCSPRSRGTASCASSTAVWPQYEFARHKGYITPEHTAALSAHGPCPQHRHSYVNVKAAQLRLDGAMPHEAMTERMEVSA